MEMIEDPYVAINRDVIPTFHSIGSVLNRPNRIAEQASTTQDPRRPELEINRKVHQTKPKYFCRFGSILSNNQNFGKHSRRIGGGDGVRWWSIP